jgi:hypothetical protein
MCRVHKHTLLMSQLVQLLNVLLVVLSNLLQRTPQLLDLSTLRWQEDGANHSVLGTSFRLIGTHTHLLRPVLRQLLELRRSAKCICPVSYTANDMR